MDGGRAGSRHTLSVWDLSNLALSANAQPGNTEAQFGGKLTTLFSAARLFVRVALGRKDGFNPVESLSVHVFKADDLGIERRYLVAASVRQRTWSFS
jgi:hypothetical protein